MKKFITAVPALLLVATACLAQQPAQSPLTIPATQTVAKALLEQPNSGAIQNTLSVDFTVTDSYATQTMQRLPSYYEFPSTYNITCRAYPLNENWLIIAGTCAQATPLQEENVIQRSHVLKLANADFSFANNPHVMLVWRNKETNGQNSFSAPFVNVLAVTTPRHLFNLADKNTFKVHLNFKDKIGTRHLKEGSNDLTTFDIDRKFGEISSYATHALFLTTAQGNEFIAAYNLATIHQIRAPGITQGSIRYDTTDSWYNLIKEDLMFIKQTILRNRPQDWEAIKTRLFFNDLQTPYFK